MTTVELVIPGRLAGEPRHRSTVIGGRVRTYADPRGKAQRHVIQTAWQAAGAPRLGTAAVGVYVRCMERRPRSHLRTNGELAAEGRRRPFPTHKPDLDNVAKSVLDSLNGLLWVDDKQVVDLRVTRVWVVGDGPEEARVAVWVVNENGGQGC